MNDDCVAVDELLLEKWSHTNNGQQVAAEKLRRVCSHIYKAYNRLQDRVHDAWLPERTRQTRAVCYYIYGCANTP